MWRGLGEAWLRLRGGLWAREEVSLLPGPALDIEGLAESVPGSAVTGAWQAWQSTCIAVTLLWEEVPHSWLWPRPFPPTRDSYRLGLQCLPGLRAGDVQIWGSKKFL